MVALKELHSIAQYQVETSDEYSSGNSIRTSII